MKLCFTILAAIAISTTAFGEYRQITLGSAANDAPWQNLYTGHSVNWLRIQFLYTSAELGGSGTVTSIGLQNHGPDIANFNNVAISIWHTTANPGGIWGLQTVPAGSERLFATTLTVGEAGAGGWENYMLDTPFEYNGTQNILVEFHQQGGTGMVPSRGISGGNSRAGWSISHANGSTSGNYNWCANIQLGFFEVQPAPELNSINPTEGNLLQTLNVNFDGDFLIDDITTVDFGSDITVNSINYTSANALTANITIGTSAVLGARDVSVFNPAPGGGTATLTDGFTVVQPAPVLTGIEPASAPLDGDELTMIVRGENFYSDAVVRFDGADRATEFYGNTEILLATIPGSDLTVLGEYDITVFSSVTSEESDPVMFAVTDSDAVPAPADFDLVAPEHEDEDVPPTGAGFDWEDAE